MRKILIIFFALSLAQCGTQVPTERKVTKVENIVGAPKKIFLEEKSEKVKDHFCLLYTSDAADNLRFQKF